MTFLFVGSSVCRWLPSDPSSRRRPCLKRVVVVTRNFWVHLDAGSSTGDFHPFRSRPCWAYTLHGSGLTKAVCGDAEVICRHCVIPLVGSISSVGNPQSYPISPKAQVNLISLTSCKTLLYKGSATQNPASSINESNKGLTPTIKPLFFASTKIPRIPV